ncbi:MAG TPA: ABC transporter ATP-binding protein [Deinococcales bacterium]|nr:ABC transporter ATP-binding protein [Deinococcales bacterium]
MTRIELRGITKRFGNVTALHEVNLTIEPGEFFTLLGPSGSGKTTLLRILAGLEAATDGTLYFDEDDVTAVPPWQRHTAMVFQNYALYPHMTIGQNIGYPLKIQKRPPDEVRRRVAEVADALQIGHLLARRPTQISGGQQQRVALARALAHQPRLFLFDEPLSNLDAKLRLEARTFLKGLQRQLGITAVYVTHDQSEAMAMSDRMAVLEQGRIRQVGTPREVYRRPADPFVATFIGNPPMNLLSVTLAATPQGRQVRLGDASFPAPESTLPDGPALLGVRPEDVRFRADDGGHIPAAIVLAEDLGHEVLVTVDAAGQRLVLRDYDERPSGARGSLDIDLARACLYPPEAKPVQETLLGAA